MIKQYAHCKQHCYYQHTCTGLAEMAKDALRRLKKAGAADAIEVSLGTNARLCLGPHLCASAQTKLRSAAKHTH